MFHRSQNKEAAKTLFRRLAMRLHPDHGGENDLMVLLQESYEKYNETFYEEIQKDEPLGYETAYENIDEGDQRLKLLIDIMAYGKAHKKFNTQFCESILEFLDEKGYITSSQYNALLKTYYAFKMNEFNQTNQKDTK